MKCPGCGEPIGSDATCSSCGADLEAFHRAEALRETRTGKNLGITKRAPFQGGGATTMFQPGVLAQDLFGEETVLAKEQEISRQRHPLPPGVAAYFLVLGARSGHERLDLPLARTTFGQRGTDFELPDPELAERHFQVDVMGGEFYLRDLGSPNGTFLNGHRIRVSELLAGDEVQAGGTILLFRCEGDSISRPAPEDG